MLMRRRAGPAGLSEPRPVWAAAWPPVGIWGGWKSGSDRGLPGPAPSWKFLLTFPRIRGENNACFAEGGGRLGPRSRALDTLPLGQGFACECPYTRRPAGPASVSLSATVRLLLSVSNEISHTHTQMHTDSHSSHAQHSDPGPTWCTAGTRELSSSLHGDPEPSETCIAGL